MGFNTVFDIKVSNAKIDALRWQLANSTNKKYQLENQIIDNIGDVKGLIRCDGKTYREMDNMWDDIWRLYDKHDTVPECMTALAATIMFMSNVVFDDDTKLDDYEIFNDLRCLYPNVAYLFKSNPEIFEKYDIDINRIGKIGKAWVKEQLNARNNDD